MMKIATLLKKLIGIEPEPEPIEPLNPSCPICLKQLEATLQHDIKSQYRLLIFYRCEAHYLIWRREESPQIGIMLAKMVARKLFPAMIGQYAVMTADRMMATGERSSSIFCFSPIEEDKK
jgi:hypothetical protein